MLKSYFELGMTHTAVFELFVRKLPTTRNFFLAAGLEPALEYLENLRFTGDVDAMLEGTPFFPDEPIQRVAAPLPEAQLVETRLVALMHYCSLIASKAALRARRAGQAAGGFRPAASASASPCTARWRTRTSRRTTTRARASWTSRGDTRRSPRC